MLSPDAKMLEEEKWPINQTMWQDARPPRPRRGAGVARAGRNGWRGSVFWAPEGEGAGGKPGARVSLWLPVFLSFLYVRQPDEKKRYWLPLH